LSNGCKKDHIIIIFIIKGLSLFQLVSSYFFYLIKKSNKKNQGSVDFLTLVHSEITQKITHDPIRLRYYAFSQPKCVTTAAGIVSCYFLAISPFSH